MNQSRRALPQQNEWKRARQPRVLDIDISTISRYDPILIGEDVFNSEIPVIPAEACPQKIGSF